MSMPSTDPRNAEVTRQVPGYPGYYATSFGRMFSIMPGGLIRKQIATGEPKWSKSRVRSSKHPRRPGPTYPTVSLKDADGIRRTIALHRVILMTFVGPRPEGMECRHLDGDKLNNRLDNLCWGTKAENIADAIRHGAMGRVLTRPEVEQIRRLHNNGMTVAKIARLSSISQHIVRKICLNLRDADRAESTAY